MSYILDALRKAEMERDLSRVPGISSHQHFARTGKRFPVKPWMLVSAAMVSGMAITWVWTRHDAVAQVQATAAITGETLAGKGEEAKAAPPESGTAMEAEAVVADVAFNPPEEGITVVAESRAVPVKVAETKRSEPVGAPVAVSGKASLEPSPQPVVEQAATAEVESTDSEEKVLDGVVAMIAAEAERGWPAVEGTAKPKPGNMKTPDTSYLREIETVVPDVVREEPLPPLLSTLPYRFQSTLPKIVINAQAYAEEVAARFVIINMQKYGEGERTREGVMIEQIGKNQLVLSYQGQVFRMQR